MRKLTVLLTLIFTFVLLNTYSAKAYEVCDDQGNCVQIELKPTVTVQPGAFPMTIQSNEQINWYQYATAYDQQDGDITANIRYVHNINYMVRGTYWLKYYVYDSTNRYDEKIVYVTVLVVEGA